MFICIRDNLLFSKTVPAKLQSYLAASKPIIGLLEGEGSEIIEKSRSGVSASNKKIIELVDKVIKLTSLDKSELNIMGKNGYNFTRLIITVVLEEHNY